MATNDNLNRFIGAGITFPLKLSNGRAVVETGKPLIESSLKDILAWMIGTRFFLGEYGSKLEYLLQEPDNQVGLALLRYYTQSLVLKWEKRVTNVKLKIVKRETGVMVIRIDYQIANTQITGSFIYPYYSQLIY